MEGQNFREFIEKYSEEIMKSSNGNDNEKEPIINKSGNETPEER